MNVLIPAEVKTEPHGTGVRGSVVVTIDRKQHQIAEVFAPTEKTAIWGVLSHFKHIWRQEP